MKKIKNSKPAPVQRTFSEAFKRQRVEEIHHRLASVSEVSKVYKVSTTAIYKWMRKYTPNLPAGVKLVIELESEAKRTLELTRRADELEKIVGRKQLQIDFLEKLVEVAGKQLKVDLKKTFSGKQ